VVQCFHAGFVDSQAVQCCDKRSSYRLRIHKLAQERCKQLLVLLQLRQSCHPSLCIISSSRQGAGCTGRDVQYRQPQGILHATGQQGPPQCCFGLPRLVWYLARGAVEAHHSSDRSTCESPLGLNWQPRFEVCDGAVRACPSLDLPRNLLRRWFRSRKPPSREAALTETESGTIGGTPWLRWCRGQACRWVSVRVGRREAYCFAGMLFGG
jgi:hypothetical protein